MHRDSQPPDWATFQVPLRFTKFDLRDYLWNLYNVEVKGVRSWVRRPVAPTKNDSGRYMRPPAEKYMTVEMTKPFVWPEAPTDLSPWDSSLYKMRENMLKKQDKMRAEAHKGNLPLASEGKLEYDEKRYRAMAKDLLEGKTKWDNGVALDEKWERLMGRKGGEAAAEAEAPVEEAEEGKDGKQTPQQ